MPEVRSVSLAADHAAGPVNAMNEKHIAWLFLASLLALVVVTSGHRRWTLDARPLLVPVQYVYALVPR